MSGNSAASIEEDFGGTMTERETAKIICERTACRPHAQGKDRSRPTKIEPMSQYAKLVVMDQEAVLGLFDPSGALREQSRARQ
jgi:hypothetical protein